DLARRRSSPVRVPSRQVVLVGEDRPEIRRQSRCCHRLGLYGFDWRLRNRLERYAWLRRVSQLDQRRSRARQFRIGGYLESHPRPSATVITPRQDSGTVEARLDVPERGFERARRHVPRAVVPRDLHAAAKVGYRPCNDPPEWHWRIPCLRVSSRLTGHGGACWARI